MVVSFTTTNYLQLQTTLSIPLYGGQFMSSTQLLTLNYLQTT